jgi:acetylornithine deacetylase/succinyl-diaminopimelate desuccinylase-like protein
MSFGGSDASRYVALGKTCIVVSPTGGGRHSDAEWIDEQGLRDFPEVLRQFIVQVC